MDRIVGTSGKTAMEVAREAAIKAGNILIERFDQVKEVSFKGRGNIVTDVDLEVEREIFDPARSSVNTDDVEGGGDHGVVAVEKEFSSVAGREAVDRKLDHEVLVEEHAPRDRGVDLRPDIVTG